MKKFYILPHLPRVSLVPHIKRLFIVSFLMLSCLFSSTGISHALDISQIRFGAHPGKIRMVLDLSETSDFRVFALSDPYRLVVDLPSFNWKAGSVENTASAGIQAVRHGNLSPGISRLVFDLSAPISVRSAFILPRAEGKPDRLVIDYTPSSAEVFAREKSNVIGTLSESGNYTHNNAYQSSSSATAPPPKPQKIKKPLIVIDPGHGGVDPGAIGANKVYEKNVVLKLAKELKQQLLATGQYDVLLTRETDVFIKLRDRVAFARKHKADLFVSIHADSIDSRSVRGASFYTLSEKASDAQTAKLAKRENNADLIAGIDLSVEDEQVANILVDLAMRDTTNQGKFFAGKMVDSFKGTGIRVLDNAHRHAGFAVLKAPDIPSILVESGFMSNRYEAEQLNTSSYRKKIAAALKSGINAYFEQVKKNQRI